MPTPRLFIIACLAIPLAACSQGEGDAPADTLAQATAAPAAANTATQSEVTYSLTPVVEGLEFPWGIEFLPDREMLITEREGRLNFIRKSGERVVVTGMPEAYVERQGGYFDVRQDPNFEENRTIYLAYAKGAADANATAIFKGKLSLDGTEITNGEDIYQADMRDTAFHYGGRMRFLPDGTLILSLGDGFRYMDDAQETSNTHGTIIRINTDGSIPADNPLVGIEGAAEEVYSWGHRNVQGLLYDVHSDTLFAHEHGPKGGDELNVIVPGQNYGWPRITYGINYDGTIITTKTAEDGLEQPRTKWVPSIAPSGLTRYTGGTYPEWTGGLLIGAMNGPAGQKLVHIELDGNN
ncbi:MAG: PQQ-dependent sugar dehydrogenase, partial [Pseudomonadota bacterium]